MKADYLLRQPLPDGGTRLIIRAADSAPGAERQTQLDTMREYPGASVAWPTSLPMDGARFHVTGRLVNGQRFAPIKTDRLGYALGINLWHGSVWYVGADGRRTLLRRVAN